MIIGNLVAAFQAVSFGKLFYRELESQKILGLKLNKGNFVSKVRLNNGSLNELVWWKHNIMESTNSITTPKIDKVIYTDASKAGWGFHSDNCSNGGRWNNTEQAKHINLLELLAMFIGLKSICKNNYKHVKIMSDNATAISYINNMGGTKSKACNKIAKDIWLWSIKEGLWISAAFIPGKDNHEADKASRQFNDATEWMLNTNVFKEITLSLGQPSIDLFASRSNRQIERYVAWKPEPEAVAIDAFSIPWTNEFNYIFPPFSVLDRTVAKIRREQAYIDI